MTLVVDASLIARLLLPDEQGIVLELLAADDLVAPWLLWAELRDILIVNERHGRLAPGRAFRRAVRHARRGAQDRGG
ncbi:hypothetical protein [Amaricoccus sp. W119]|uniref:hypothetical protein n=1 Tax=Amaricoccus sp. W119 TaxID=3391833 RepID=UPI0039A425CF